MNTEQASENICNIYLSHTVLKSRRSKIATLAQYVCDVHRAFSLYIKTFWQSSMYMYNTYI